jgi:periplasmic divalent cation tolerance protein
MTTVVLVLSTLPSDFDATSLARDIVDRRLAACVTILPSVQSVYVWKGAAHVDHEQQLVMKTSQGVVDQLVAHVRTRHPYEVPEFLVVPVTGGSDDYLGWIETQVSTRHSD